MYSDEEEIAPILLPEGVTFNDQNTRRSNDNAENNIDNQIPQESNQVNIIPVARQRTPVPPPQHPVIRTYELESEASENSEDDENPDDDDHDHEYNDNDEAQRQESNNSRYQELESESSRSKSLSQASVEGEDQNSNDHDPFAKYQDDDEPEANNDIDMSTDIGDDFISSRPAQIPMGSTDAAAVTGKKSTQKAKESKKKSNKSKHLKQQPITAIQQPIDVVTENPYNVTTMVANNYHKEKKEKKKSKTEKSDKKAKKEKKKAEKLAKKSATNSNQNNTMSMNVDPYSNTSNIQMSNFQNPNLHPQTGHGSQMIQNQEANIPGGPVTHHNVNTQLPNYDSSQTMAMPHQQQQHQQHYAPVSNPSGSEDPNACVQHTVTTVDPVTGQASTYTYITSAAEAHHHAQYYAQQNQSAQPDLNNTGYGEINNSTGYGHDINNHPTGPPPPPNQNQPNNPNPNPNLNQNNPNPKVPKSKAKAKSKSINGGGGGNSSKLPKTFTPAVGTDSNGEPFHYLITSHNPGVDHNGIPIPRILLDAKTKQPLPRLMNDPNEMYIFIPTVYAPDSNFVTQNQDQVKPDLCFAYPDDEDGMIYRVNEIPRSVLKGKGRAANVAAGRPAKANIKCNAGNGKKGTTNSTATTANHSNVTTTSNSSNLNANANALPSGVQGPLLPPNMSMNTNNVTSSDANDSTDCELNPFPPTKRVKIDPTAAYDPLAPPVISPKKGPSKSLKDIHARCVELFNLGKNKDKAGQPPMLQGKIIQINNNHQQNQIFGLLECLELHTKGEIPESYVKDICFACLTTTPGVESLEVGQMVWFALHFISLNPSDPGRLVATLLLTPNEIEKAKAEYNSNSNNLNIGSTMLTTSDSISSSNTSNINMNMSNVQDPRSSINSSTSSGSEQRPSLIHGRATLVPSVGPSSLNNSSLSSDNNNLLTSNELNEPRRSSIDSVGTLGTRATIQYQGGSSGNFQNSNVGPNVDTGSTIQPLGIPKVAMLQMNRQGRQFVGVLSAPYENDHTTVECDDLLQTIDRSKNPRVPQKVIPLIYPDQLPTDILSLDILSLGNTSNTESLSTLLQKGTVVLFNLSDDDCGVPIATDLVFPTLTKRIAALAAMNNNKKSLGSNFNSITNGNVDYSAKLEAMGFTGAGSNNINLNTGMNSMMSVSHSNRTVPNITGSTITTNKRSVHIINSSSTNGPMSTTSNTTSSNQHKHIQILPKPLSRFETEKQLEMEFQARFEAKQALEKAQKEAEREKKREMIIAEEMAKKMLQEQANEQQMKIRRSIEAAKEEYIKNQKSNQENLKIQQKLNPEFQKIKEMQIKAKQEHDQKSKEEWAEEKAKARRIVEEKMKAMMGGNMTINLTIKPSKQTPVVSTVGTDSNLNKNTITLMDSNLVPSTSNLSSNDNSGNGAPADSNCDSDSTAFDTLLDKLSNHASNMSTQTQSQSQTNTNMSNTNTNSNTNNMTIKGVIENLKGKGKGKSELKGILKGYMMATNKGFTEHEILPEMKPLLTNNLFTNTSEISVNDNIDQSDDNSPVSKSNSDEYNFESEGVVEVPPASTFESPMSLDDVAQAVNQNINMISNSLSNLNSLEDQEMLDVADVDMTPLSNDTIPLSTDYNNNFKIESPRSAALDCVNAITDMLDTVNNEVTNEEPDDQGGPVLRQASYRPYNDNDNDDDDRWATDSERISLPPSRDAIYISRLSNPHPIEGRAAALQERRQNLSQGPGLRKSATVGSAAVEMIGSLSRGRSAESSQSHKGECSEEREFNRILAEGEAE